ncbi:hypothetical protein CPT_Stills94 [Bacillus phage Stills]|uniref:Uncharacterized protein n=1 Tax=Bacillus phage Stills TaxID=1610833 RepID=A0A0E3X9N6_9CAUD|nr:hypothetical protein CPT_Stills94 [Bacillus phage Stills]AKC02722.1 hypothetical protein CPT_Stills94 [Bacillus phage Stills]
MKKLHWCAVCHKFEEDKENKKVYPFNPEIEYVITPRICNKCKRKKVKK